MRHPASLGLLLPVLLTATYSWAQSPEARINAPGGNPRDLPQSPNVHHVGEEGRVVFRTQTILIQVPVVVTDKSGNHIHSLSKEQFQIFENGKEQKIASFEERVAKNTPIPPAPSTSDVFSNLAIPQDQPRSVTVIAIDLVNTPFLDQAYGRQQLIKYLGDNLDSGQAMALVVFDGSEVRVLHGLTTDAASLVKILKELGGQLPALQGVRPSTQAETVGPLLLPTGAETATLSIRSFIDGGVTYAGWAQQDAVLATMRAFMIIAESLSGIPGRKALIWATGSFPFYMNSPDTSPVNTPAAAQMYERAIAALNEAQISVYPVDVRGLVYYGPTAERNKSGGAAFANFLTARGQSLSTSIETLQNFAETTGGRAFYNRNDLSAEFKRAADDSSSYYLLGYYLDTHNNKAGWRKLKVKVLLRDTEVRARDGFLLTSATMNPDTTHDSDLKIALNSPFDATGIPLTLRWKTTAATDAQKDADKKEIAFTLQIPGKDLVGAGSEKEIDVDVVAVARIGSLIADHVSKSLKGAVPPEKFAKLKSEGVDYSGDLHLAPGNYLVRFVVRDNQSGRMGSLTAPLAVK